MKDGRNADKMVKLVTMLEPSVVYTRANRADLYQYRSTAKANADVSSTIKGAVNVGSKVIATLIPAKSVKLSKDAEIKSALNALKRDVAKLTKLGFTKKQIVAEIA